MHELKYDWIEGAELAAALGDDSAIEATDVRVAVVRGSGTALDSGAQPFHEVPIARASSETVAAHLSKRRRPRASLDVGAMLLEPELRVAHVAWLIGPAGPHGSPILVDQGSRSGAGDQVPECSVGVIREGQDELRPSAPRAT